MNSASCQQFLRCLRVHKAWRGRGGDLYRIPLLVLSLLAAIALCIHPAEAVAHPYGRNYLSHRVIAALDGKTLRIEYIAEIPTPVIMKEFYKAYGERSRVGREEDREFALKKLKALAAGVKVWVDGQEMTLPETTPPSTLNGLGDYNFFTYRLRWEGPLTVLPGSRHTLEVKNANYPGLPTYYSGGIKLPADWQFQGGTMLRISHRVSLDDPAEIPASWIGESVMRDPTATFSRDHSGIRGWWQKRWRGIRGWWERGK